MPDNYSSEQERYFKQWQTRVFRAVYTISQWMEGEMADGVAILRIDVQSPKHTGGDYRAVIKGRDAAGSRWVAFVNGNTLEELHANIAREGEERGFRWREDKPWSPSGP